MGCISCPAVGAVWPVRRAVWPVHARAGSLVACSYSAGYVAFALGDRPLTMTMTRDLCCTSDRLGYLAWFLYQDTLAPGGHPARVSGVLPGHSQLDQGRDAGWPR